MDKLFDKVDENHIYSHNQYQQIIGGKVSPVEYDNYRCDAGRLQGKSSFEGSNCITSGASYLSQYLRFR